MLNLLLHLIEKKSSDKKLRKNYGVLSGSLGLTSNLLLFLMKFFIGLSARSVSIMADAINNLSDAASSVVTLFGFQVAAKPADSEHPYGHERFEYISGFVISIIITVVGFQFLTSAIKKIIQPVHLNLSPWLFLVLLISILIKFWQSRMYLKISDKIQSTTLKATSQDSLNDVITTVAVLVSAGVEGLTGWRVDGYVGLLIALYILYSGLSMVREFVNELMGNRPTDNEIKEMERRLDNYQTILGYHDLLVHSYGPEKRFASVHIEVDETWSLNHAHDIIDAIEKDFWTHLHVALVCHLDPVAIHDEEYKSNLLILKELLFRIDPDLRVHDFRIEAGTLSFDVVVPQKISLSDDEIRETLEKTINHSIGKFKLDITFDHNYLL
ncbi:cation diffusion facilitator family transporter [Enterococcus massiliensis]|uniref:cation diffusion facilitator family transporter n=1 Tax=Enterococcus massiliensis TaxID=1640685 RepID=UPI00065E14E0|nr:cation diffusion facilitator family transporter [Enterococcus massiliensis]